MKHRRRSLPFEDVNPLWAALEAFLCKLAEKIAEKVGEWLAYRLLLWCDPSYYVALQDTQEVTPDPIPPDEEAK